MELLKKPKVRILLGSLLTPSGSFMGYFYIQNLGEVNPIFFLLAAFMLPTGLYFLTKSLAPTLARVERIETEEQTDGSLEPNKPAKQFESTISKNNEMLQTWNQTNKTRDELKMLEISENAKAAAEK